MRVIDLIAPAKCCGSCRHWEPDGPSGWNGWCPLRDERMHASGKCENYERIER